MSSVKWQPTAEAINDTVKNNFLHLTEELAALVPVFKKQEPLVADKLAGAALVIQDIAMARLLEDGGERYTRIKKITEMVEQAEAELPEANGGSGSSEQARRWLEKVMDMPEYGGGDAGSDREDEDSEDEEKGFL